MDVLVTCPHCNNPVAIAELNCRIFRHGTTKDFQPVNPHATKQICDMLVERDMLLEGCGKPFYVIGDGDAAKAVVCEYI